jgi:hypothetical protein
LKTSPTRKPQISQRVRQHMKAACGNSSGHFTSSPSVASILFSFSMTAGFLLWDSMGFYFETDSQISLKFCTYQVFSTNAASLWLWLRTWLSYIGLWVETRLVQLSSVKVKLSLCLDWAPPH